MWGLRSKEKERKKMNGENEKEHRHDDAGKEETKSFISEIGSAVWLEKN